MHHLLAQEKTRDWRYEQTLVRLRHEQTLDRRSEARKKVGNVATQIDCGDGALPITGII